MELLCAPDVDVAVVRTWWSCSVRLILLMPLYVLGGAAVLAYTRKSEGFIGFIGFNGFTVILCTDNWSWYSFLAGFSHPLYCVGFNEANGEYWTYVLSFLICACCFVFHGNIGHSKRGSVAISHSLLSQGGRHGPTPIFSFSLKSSALLR